MGIIEDKILVLLSDVTSNVLFEQIPEFLFCLIMALCYILLLVEPWRCETTPLPSGVPFYFSFINTGKTANYI